MKKIIYIFIITITSLILHMNLQSQVIWNRIYNGPESLSDSAVGIAANNSGGLFVTGLSVGSSTGLDIVTIRYNETNGTPMWVNRYASPLEERPTAFVADENYVYMTGWGFRTVSLRDVIVIKYNAVTGDTVFVRYYNNANGGDYGRAITVDNSGNVYVTGRSDIGGAQKFTTIKYDPAGNQLWVSVYTGTLSTTFDEALAIKVDASGNAYVTGYCNATGTGAEDILTLKLNNSDGTVAWEKRYNGPMNHEDKAYGIALDNAGANVFVGGFASRPTTVQDFFAIKYSASTGDSVSAIYYSSSSNIEFAFAMAKDDSDNVYLAGFTYLSGGNHFQTVRFNSSLTNVDWAKQVAENDNSVASSIAFDTSGFIWVTGNSSSPTTARDYLTIRYNAFSGEETWRRKDSGPGVADDYATGIACIFKESVCVTGSLNSGTNGGTNFFTTRYHFPPIGIKSISSEVPASFNLEQNYPNPFNPVTNIRFDVSKSSNIKIVIFDVLGREIAVLADEKFNPGKYEVNWNASNMSSGIYFYKLIAGDFAVTKKMILNK